MHRPRRLAVDTQGPLITTSKLGDTGYEVVSDKQFINALREEEESLHLFQPTQG